MRDIEHIRGDWCPVLGTLSGGRAADRTCRACGAEVRARYAAWSPASAWNAGRLAPGRSTQGDHHRPHSGSDVGLVLAAMFEGFEFFVFAAILLLVLFSAFAGAIASWLS